MNSQRVKKNILACQKFDKLVKIMFMGKVDEL